MAGCSSGVFPGSSGFDTSNPDGPPDNVPPGTEIGEPAMPPKGPQPQFGRTVTQADAPPPLSGGTLVVTEEGIAVAADPDRDQVYVVGLEAQSVKKVVLQKHDEPGRVVMDDAGRAHVVLRSGGGVATIDVATGTLLARRNVCPAPRGIAFDKSRARLLVACADGQLAALPPAPDGAKTLLATLERDLRDIVVLGDRIFVSKFRSASVVELNAAGVLQSPMPLLDAAEATPTLAWRMIAPSASAPSSPDASTPGATKPIVLHQLASLAPLSTQPGGYGDSSGSDPDTDVCQVHKSTTSVLDVSGEKIFFLPTNLVLPVDVAVVSSGYAVIAAGNGHTPSLPQVYVMPESVFTADGFCSVPTKVMVPGQATSVAAYRDSFVVQSREPASLFLAGQGARFHSTTRVARTPATPSSTRTRVQVSRALRATVKAATTGTCGSSTTSERVVRLRCTARSPGRRPITGMARSPTSAISATTS
ncbi:Cytochrome c551 peroxidase [Labilithrix luteola]|uniref:Cytochrome c551 peroxidase n=2 Tax=Labilithrix luteola TaxID=1391654 RepID=A0A0K1PLR2_9BACT|nr:Cytochrome c551 peroxidase [Labilithrix luteola]